MNAAVKKESRTRDAVGVLKRTGLDVKKATIAKIFPEDLMVVMDPAHPLYDPRVTWPLDPQMIASIERDGVLNVITGCKNGEDAHGHRIIEVVDGRRRTLHAREVNRQRKARGDEPIRVRVDIQTGSYAQLVLIAMAENSHRKDDTLMSRAVKVQNALKLGNSKADVAGALRSNLPAIEQILLFLDLAPEAQQVFDTNKLPIGALADVAKLPREQQPDLMIRCAEAHVHRAADVRSMIRAVRTGRPYAPTKRVHVMHRAKVEEIAQAVEPLIEQIPLLRGAWLMSQIFLGDGEKLAELTGYINSVAGDQTTDGDDDGGGNEGDGEESEIAVEAPEDPSELEEGIDPPHEDLHENKGNFAPYQLGGSHRVLSLGGPPS